MFHLSLEPVSSRQYDRPTVFPGIIEIAVDDSSVDDTSIDDTSVDDTAIYDASVNEASGGEALLPLVEIAADESLLLDGLESLNRPNCLDCLNRSRTEGGLAVAARLRGADDVDGGSEVGCGHDVDALGEALGTGGDVDGICSFLAKGVAVSGFDGAAWFFADFCHEARVAVDVVSDDHEEPVRLKPPVLSLCAP